MHEAISNPGVKFIFFKLHGTLSYIVTRTGKPPKVYKLHADDFDNDSDGPNDDNIQVKSETPENGTTASAVGLRLQLVKNDGVLEMEYESGEGATAKWMLDGLALHDGGIMCTAAGTQTEQDAEKCAVCGRGREEKREVMHREVQTDTTATRSMDTQTTGYPATSTAVQTTSNPIPTPPSDDQSTTPNLKRKASLPPPTTPEPLHKCAKTLHESPPWPRHMYMTCSRNGPKYKGDTGVLHIDIEQGTVWFEGWYGKKHTCVHERKQIDLHDTQSTYPTRSQVRWHCFTERMC